MNWKLDVGSSVAVSSVHLTCCAHQEKSMLPGYCCRVTRERSSGTASFRALLYIWELARSALPGKSGARKR